MKTKNFLFVSLLTASTFLSFSALGEDTKEPPPPAPSTEMRTVVPKMTPFCTSMKAVAKRCGTKENEFIWEDSDDSACPTALEGVTAINAKAVAAATSQIARCEKVKDCKKAVACADKPFKALGKIVQEHEAKNKK